MTSSRSPARGGQRRRARLRRRAPTWMKRQRRRGAGSEERQRLPSGTRDRSSPPKRASLASSRPAAELSWARSSPCAPRASAPRSAAVKPSRSSNRRARACGSARDRADQRARGARRSSVGDLAQDPRSPRTSNMSKVRRISTEIATCAAQGRRRCALHDRPARRHARRRRRDARRDRRRRGGRRAARRGPIGTSCARMRAHRQGAVHRRDDQPATSPSPCTRAAGGARHRDTT